MYLTKFDLETSVAPTMLRERETVRKTVFLFDEKCQQQLWAIKMWMISEEKTMQVLTDGKSEIFHPRFSSCIHTLSSVTSVVPVETDNGQWPYALL